MRLRCALAAGAWIFVLAIHAAISADLRSGVVGSALSPDSALQRSLQGVVDELQLNGHLAKKHLALSLVDVTDIGRPRYAGLNDSEMMYAASLPKICALVAGFEQIRAGQLKYTPAIKAMFTRMIRYSSNPDASMAIQTVGFDYISKVLTSAKYGFYNAQENGGLWLGKAYGGPNDYWRLDPVHHLSHGATTFQVARFSLMLQEGRLVRPGYSAEMKEILSKPGINHKL
jgi:beta-lactamase class A